MLKKMLIFCGLFMLFYGLLLVIGNTDGFNKSFLSAVSSWGNSSFSEFRDGGMVQFADEHPQKQKKDELIISLSSEKLVRQAQRKARKGKKNIGARGVSTEMNTWNFIYLPLSFFLALVLASPINWKRKLLILPLGILILGIFFWLKTYVFIYMKFFSADWLQIEQAEGAFYFIISKLYSPLVYIGTSLTLATALWILLCFRVKDLKEFLSLA